MGSPQPMEASLLLRCSDLDGHKAVSHTFYLTLHCLTSIFALFLQYTFTEVPPAWLQGSAMPAGGSCKIGRNQPEPTGTFRALTETAPAAPAAST